MIKNLKNLGHDADFVPNHLSGLPQDVPTEAIDKLSYPGIPGECSNSNKLRTAHKEWKVAAAKNRKAQKRTYQVPLM